MANTRHEENGELREVADRLRRVVVEELELDRALAGVHRGCGHAGTVASLPRRLLNLRLTAC